MKKLILAAAAAVAVLALSGCIPTPLAQSLTKEDRADFERACHEAGGVSGENYESMPYCSVTYYYPRLPEASNE